MCGVFGWISYRKGLDARAIEDARHATSLLGHRGPDHQGEWHDANVYMGHRRLSIIDLNPEANQPFADQSGRWRLSFNGEIYNYLELRQELEQAGAQFRTRSDTEVLLASFLRWGAGAFTRCDGMFAGAVQDCATGDLVLMRDPLGQKPLYYALTPDGIVYASELRSILTLPPLRWTLDRAAFLRYAMLGFYGWDETPILGVKKLLPGCCLRVNREGARLERYWDSLPAEGQRAIGADAAADEFSQLFARSCAQSMRSDVPYGVFLSGGIDSSLVLSFCREINPDIASAHVAMSEADYDESAKAATVNSVLGIARHHRFDMTPDAVQRSLGEVWAALDEPHADPGYVNAHFLARSARPFMTVALAGDGGDELFAGYAPFQALGAASVMRGVPAPVTTALRCAARRLPPGDSYVGLQFKALSFLRGFPASDAVRIPLWLSAIGPDELRLLCPWQEGAFFAASGAPNSMFAGTEALLAPLGGRPFDQLLYYYQKIFLPEFVCMHTDRASMLSSLEVRSPFLSLPLIEFANGLPHRLKARGGRLKTLLREVAARRGLPPDIVTQRKQGFTFPLARWLKGTLRSQAELLLSDRDWSDNLVDTGRVRQYLDDHLAGRSNNYRLLYHLMVFRTWRRNYPNVGIA
jgi:asparagine synthase (glutamine-hydrolysing)